MRKFDKRTIEELNKIHNHILKQNKSTLIKIKKFCVEIGAYEIATLYHEELKKRNSEI